MTETDDIVPVLSTSSNFLFPTEINVPSPNPSLSSILSVNGISSVEIPVERHGELRTIPPRKTVFATRFHYDTTVDEIKNFIKTKFNDKLPENVLIFKINSRNRASFKIIVPVELFDLIVNPIFWPKNALVREFIYREENFARLPSSANQTYVPATENLRKDNNSLLPTNESNGPKN